MTTQVHNLVLLEEIVQGTEAQPYGVNKGDAWVVNDNPGEDGPYLSAQLEGTETAGVYLRRADNTSCALVFDIDVPYSGDASRMAQAIFNSAPVKSQRSFTCSTGGRGFHVWVLFAEPQDIPALHTWARSVLWLVGLEGEEKIELFPKDSQTPGWGNLIRLPFGVHRKTGEQSVLVSFNDIPPSTIPAQHYPAPLAGPTQVHHNGHGNGSNWMSELWSGVNEGGRNNLLRKLTYLLKEKWEFPPEVVRLVISVANENYCNPPIDPLELERTVLRDV